MSNLTDFQFVVLMAAALATILGAIKLITGLFQSGRREICMKKFQKHELDIELLKKSIGNIEDKLEKIENSQNKMNDKIDRFFEIVSKLPRRKSNGEEG